MIHKEILLAHLLLSTTCYCQNSEFIGPQSNAVANASVTYNDIFSIFNNPGALGYLENESVSVGYYNRFELADLSTAFVAVNKRIKSGFAAIGISRFGDELFNHTKIIAGYGNTLGIAAIGGSIIYHQINIEGFGSKSLISFDLGGVARLTPEIRFGASIKNVSQAEISKISGERYPTQLITGISYLPTHSLILSLQVNKNMFDPLQVKTGLEYQLKALHLRAGFNSSPSWFSFGCGFHHKKLKFDYALQNHPLLGRSHSIALTYDYKQ